VAACLNIVIVEDHDMLRSLFVEVLTKHGHHAYGLFCAEEVDDEIVNSHVDIYVIDVNLPGEDGMSLAARIRSAFPNVGIVMATARDQAADKIRGYEQGADIYLAKPVDPRELLLAIETLGRRVLRPLAHQGSRLDAQLCQFAGPDGTIVLATSEAALLAALARAKGKMLESWQVAVHLGMTDDDINRRSMEARISLLRKKLAQCGVEGPTIKAVRGQGYMLCLPLEVS